MKSKTIPNTDIEVSELCLGSMNWGQQNSEAEAHEQLDFATSNGINFIDTAEVYPIVPEKLKQGRTESYIGSWLRKSGKRKDLVIASKVAGSVHFDVMGTRQATALDRKNIREAVEGSLLRLGTDYLDLYQVHAPNRSANIFGVRGLTAIDAKTDGTSIEETLTALTELVKEGKVRAVGVSNETPWGVSEYLRLSREKGLARISTIQNQYSLINRTFEIGLAEMCLRENVGLLPYSVLSMGVLTGKYLGGARPAGSRFALFARNQGRYNPPRAQVVVEKYLEVAKKHGLSPAGMAVAFAASRSFVTSTILGATSVAQLQEVMDAKNFPLAPEVLVDIEALYQEYPDPTA